MDTSTATTEIAKARDEFYERKGARQAPAAANSKFDPILRWQPRR